MGQKTLTAKLQEIDLIDRIERIALEFPGYGYRRVTYALKREGINVNHKKVLRVMNENGLLCVIRKEFKPHTTDSNHKYLRYLNLIKDLVIDKLNQVWVADITYIRILTGFVYLAAILDGLSRKVIGYAISKRLDTGLTLGALKMAIASREITSGIIHHSDAGVQYASDEYIAELNKYGFRIGMAGKGNPYDNAMMESFIKTLKYEEVYLFEYETIEDVWASVVFFLEKVYNEKRLHSSLGYLTPEEFETKHYEKQTVPAAFTLT